MSRPRTGSWLGLGALISGFAFLYVPIVLLVLYSFNESRLVTVWAGFSTRWYGALAHDKAFVAAALTSLEVAAMAASLSLVLGTLAGFGMTRLARFPGRAGIWVKHLTTGEEAAVRGPVRRPDIAAVVAASVASALTTARRHALARVVATGCAVVLAQVLAARTRRTSAREPSAKNIPVPW